MSATSFTAEQQAAIDAFLAGQSLVLSAFAGTGKTTTLKGMGMAAPERKGLYLAYNKGIQLDAAASFPSNVKCQTAHSVAYGWMMGQMDGKSILAKFKRLPRVPSWTTARVLNIPNQGFNGTDGGMRQNACASAALQTVVRFCNSDATEVGKRHVPREFEGITQDEFATFVVPFARKAWADMISINGSLKVGRGDDVYLKLWSLACPKLRYDFILFDEAQDANPCIAHVVNAQDAQVVMVGDSCQPTGTMVTVVTSLGGPGKATITKQVPIEQIHVGDRVVSYDMQKAFLRRTGSLVAGISVRPVLDSELIAVKVGDNLSRYTPSHHCVARIAPALRDKYIVYLMERNGDYRIGMAPGLYTKQGNRPGFMVRAAQEGATSVWILRVCDTRAEAVVDEQRLSGKFGLSQLIFRATNSSVMTQTDLDSVWNEIGGNREAAANAANFCGRNINYPIWTRANSDNLFVRRASVIRACNLITGMEMLTVSGAKDANGKRVSRNLWTPIDIAHEIYNGQVYSMTVENDHTYIGDNVITHNCQAIYGWRGAVDAMKNFKADAHLMITQSFRFGPAVAAEANKFLALLGAEGTVKGFDKLDSQVTTIINPDAILCRTNAQAIAEAMEAQARGMKVALCGGTKDIERFVKAAEKLMSGGKTEHEELIAFATWGEVVSHSNEAEGRDLKVMVNLITNYGTQAILDVCAASVDEKTADLVVSTAHKAKGREWNSVRIANDFRAPEEGNEPRSDEMMLCYVSVTRAKLALDCSALSWIDAFR